MNNDAEYDKFIENKMNLRKIMPIDCFFEVVQLIQDSMSMVLMSAAWSVGILLEFSHRGIF